MAYRFLIPLALLTLVHTGPLGAAPALFGYQETPHADFSMFEQWVRVLERQLVEDTPPGEDCGAQTFNRCHLREWRAFLESISNRSRSEQLRAVNRYANNKDYVLDIDNYGLQDYWAVVREFLSYGGDCEDYAITKMFSLKWLGYAPENLRIVVLQDTNLRTPHAVLAVYAGRRILVMDNQIEEVVDHRSIVHYTPVYSINENGWWLHSPAG